MKPVHAHRAPQPILGFISIDVFFHTVSIYASKLLRENGNDGLRALIFFGGVFLGTARFLAIREE